MTLVPAPELMLLGLLALGVRVCGAAGRVSSLPFWVRLIGWVWCAVSFWVAAGLFGAWFPIWPVLLIAIAGAFLEYRGEKQWVRIIADMACLIAAATLTVSRIDLTSFVAVLLIVPALGYALDRLVTTLPRLLDAALPMAPFAVAVVLAKGMPSLMLDLWKEDKTFPLYLGITVPDAGQFIRLETGAAAWLALPASEGPFSGAVLFHGANSAGSHQPASYALQRALLKAGFAVLSVDHPGFGRSPVPSANAPLEAWDSLPTGLAGIAYLRNGLGIDDIIIVGHSMGGSDVLRILGAGADIRRALLFGVAVPDPDGRDDFWYERFHRDRGLTQPIARDQWMAIRGFYDNRELAKALPSDHAPILFVRFGFEWRNVAAQRDELYKALPGRSELLDMADATHYFNTFSRRQLIIGDTRIAPRLASHLHMLRQEM